MSQRVGRGRSGSRPRVAGPRHRSPHRRGRQPSGPPTESPKDRRSSAHIAVRQIAGAHGRFTTSLQSRVLSCLRLDDQINRAEAAQSTSSYPIFGSTAAGAYPTAAGQARASKPTDFQPAGPASIRAVQAASGASDFSHEVSSGARWITRHFQAEFVTATYCPVVMSLIWAMNPPSPICCLRVSMYSSPVSLAL